MAFDQQDNFHVAVRTKNMVIKYDTDFSHDTNWVSTLLPDNPEFLLYVPD